MYIRLPRKKRKRKKTNPRQKGLKKKKMISPVDPKGSKRLKR